MHIAVLVCGTLVALSMVVRLCFNLSWLLLAVLLHRTLQNKAVALLVFASETHANFVWIFLAMIFNFSKMNYLGHYFDVHSKVSFVFNRNS